MKLEPKLAFALIALSLANAGCTHLQGTVTGAAVGGATGAVVAGPIGAVLGAGAGIVAGPKIASRLD
jgi:hypothetical protein